MLNINDLSKTVNLLYVLLSLFSTTALAQLKPVGMEAKLVAFIQDSTTKNHGVQNVKLSNEAWLLQREEQKNWNTAGIHAIATETDQEKMSISGLIRGFTTTIKGGLKKNVQESSVLENFNEDKGTNRQVKHEEKVVINWKVQPEKMRGRINAAYKSFNTEANLAANGKREIASYHRLSDLGVTTKVSYRFDTQTTITSLDKNITDNVVTRVSHSAGILEESRAEVIYSQSF